MSAIAGLYHLNNDPIEIEQIRNVMNGFQQFPADDVQTWHKQNIFLGCHAQWITPESVGEQLPYYDSNRKLAITADAIIDNREELFERLQVDYEGRKRITDSELILLSYYKWGEDCPKYLIGDFAFMIWDEKRHCLFGARDFSGGRTLYYYHNQNRFAFSTTVKPLLSLPYVEKRLNEEWLAEFLAIPNMLDSVDAASTVYQNIFQVPPSHSIKVTNERISFSRYCKLIDVKELHLKSDEEYVEAFCDVFNKAVTSQTRTYKQVGARLSGGLDSGSIASFAAKALQKENKKLHTFSYIPVSDFVDWTAKRRIPDESPYIKSTVDYIGNIHAEYLDFKGKSAYSVIDDFLTVLEMPYKFLENSFWLKGIYDKASRKGIGVLLNGGRGNYTISWGPALDYYAILLKKLSLIRLYQELQQHSRYKGIDKAHLIRWVGKRAFPAISQYLSHGEQYQYPMLINEKLAKSTNVFQKLKENGVNLSGHFDAFEARKSHFTKLTSWSLNSTSRAKYSLKYSLWDRDPTNDLRVVKFCLSLPYNQYVQNGLDRALIRRATKNYLPDNIRMNLRTRGIQGADGVHRMKHIWSDFIQEVEQLCQDSVISNYLNIEVIKEAISKIGAAPRPEYAYDAEFKILMRSVIVGRFLKKLA